MTQTTPTRDEAVLKAADEMREYMQGARFGHTSVPTSVLAAWRHLISRLASAPAPASGGVDAVAVKALMKAVQRAEDGAGTIPAKEAVKLRPADWHAVCDRARAIASLSPAATPVSEAEPGEGMVEMAEIARIVSEWRHGPMLSAEALRQIAALAKPASSPAGGDVEAIDDLLDRVASEVRQALMDVAHASRGLKGRASSVFISTETMTSAIILSFKSNGSRAALSQSTSAGRFGE